MSVVIFAFAEDVTKPPFRSNVPQSSEKTYRVVIPTLTQRHALTRYISHAKLRDEKISTLHLVAHGSPGRLFLSGPSPKLALDAGGCSWFGALRSHFETAFPRVIIHGCNSGSGTAMEPTMGYGSYALNQTGVGYEFALAMAKATGAIVEIGIHRQFNDPGYELEGPRLTVGPNGAALGAEYQYANYGQAL
ncbi:MAG: hypothetical protein R3C53_09675 [Pirellulaceae bacterium]